MTKEQKKYLPYILWFNLFIGIYNIYIWSVDNWWFNIFIGSINIGVWVFNRHLLRQEK